MNTLNLNLFFAGLAISGLAGLACLVFGLLSGNPLVVSGLMSTTTASVGLCVFFVSSVIGFVSTSHPFVLFTDKQERDRKKRKDRELYIALCVGWGLFWEANGNAELIRRKLSLRELLKLRKDCLNLKHHKDVAAIDVLIGELRWWEC